MLKKNAGYVSDQNVDFSLASDRLYGVYHTDVLAHLKGNLSCLKLYVFKALSANHLVELQCKFGTGFGDLHAFVVATACQVLQEVSKVTFILVVLAAPAIHIRVCNQIHASNALRSRVRVDISILKNDWLQISIVCCNDPWLWLVQLFDAQVLWQVNYLRAFQ
jgi:hypothetical protein